MKKIHLDQCPSTQDYLLEKLREGKIWDLVSTQVQTSGHGRHDNKWVQLKHTLCFSFICKPHEVLTLTSAEISTIICHYFRKRFNQPLFMKWPNDLLNSEGQKCGGLIINNVEKKSVVGVGLNLFADSEDQIPTSTYPIGYILPKAIEDNTQELIEELVSFILDNRLSSAEIEKDWESFCYHNSKVVCITDGDYKVVGQFVGIGKNGEALIQKGPELLKIYNGHLRIQD